MQKQPPSVARIATMVAFSLSCIGILLFLWTSFGGPVPLKPKLYRFYADFPNSPTLVREADVRIAGINVGKVKKIQLAPGGRATKTQLEIKSQYAPIPEDTKATLREKTLLGETFVELTPGSPNAPKLPEDGVLTHNNVETHVLLDEILRTFDPQTRRAFRGWVRGVAKSIEGGTGENFNDALGNLPGFATDTAGLTETLDRQQGALKLFVRNTGVVFDALTERQGVLQSLIRNSYNTFDATNREQNALAETFAIFPTFLDESRFTLARLQRFAVNTHPLVNDLKPVAREVPPTIRDLAALSPDLKRLFLDLRPLIRESPQTLPQAARFLRGARDPLAGLHTFLPQLNPVLSFLDFNQLLVSDFISNGAAATALELPVGASNQKLPVLNEVGVINNKTLEQFRQRPNFDRGSSYNEPNYANRLRPLGVPESFTCTNARPAQKSGGHVPEDPSPQNGNQAQPPCFVKPDSLWPNGREFFPRVERGVSPVIPAPGPSSEAGTRPPGG